ncbi:MAG TPA: hypothetical protein P5518_01640 [Candidatus Cloacimonas sp.]|jgi:hypothetical protein|nr:hypothetical protein [Candidatus Cloacimonas sp.]MDD2249905.1 hypothetical protein [Candidatus Cloacimonadota bacterium]MCK9157916.1 hypothetical protein [Candidatus Cloacimonas sp.]MCK9164653.1 hypothetical protein [Candidatus Cloacimonas sp.]MDD3733697.1 hypothetical protein [Candidatus Cloacimonadota bacterium]
MRGKILILVSLLGVVFFLSFYNNNRIVQYTRQISELEKTYYAEKNINTELLVELDDLRSGRHIASLVRVELSNFIPDQQAGKIIYVHEPSAKQDKKTYCIIDLLTTKAEAKNIQVLLD